VNLGVTPAGRKVVAEVIERRRIEVRSVLEGVSADARRQLVDSLYVLAAAAGQSPEPHWSPGWHE
jgi:DNA-binding MarR family transcriptional regulator